MERLKIAKEILRIAKDLIAANIANQKGKYKNFTGIIDWVGNKGEVKNATFELKDDGIILFDGTWIDGVWSYGKWKKGVWKNGTWKYGTWENGAWENGEWKDGWWEDGIWKKGVWKGGVWKNGTWENGNWKQGSWLNGIWIKGDWSKNSGKAIWYFGKDKKGKTHGRGDSPDKW